MLLLANCITSCKNLLPLLTLQEEPKTYVIESNKNKPVESLVTYMIMAEKQISLCAYVGKCSKGRLYRDKCFLDENTTCLICSSIFIMKGFFFFFVLHQYHIKLLAIILYLHSKRNIDVEYHFLEIFTIFRW